MLLQLPKLFQNNAKWLEKQQTNILSAAVVITVANILSSLSGLLRERLMISVFFSSTDSQRAYEAFQVAFQIPDMMFQLLILGAVSAAFIPIFTKLRQKDPAEAFTMTSIVMNWLLLVFLFASAAVAFFAYPITAARTGVQFTAEQIHITAQLTRIMLGAQLLFAVSNFLSGILQSYQRFIIPAVAPVLYNIGILIGVYAFSPWLGIYSAGVGVVIGAFMHMVVQLPLAFKFGFRFRPLFNLRFAGVKQFFSLMPPRLVTLSISELQNLALGFFTTSLGGLSFVIIRLALRLMTIPIRLFGVPISQASLPFLSEEYSEDNLLRFRQLIVRSLNQIAFLSFPASVLLLILRVPFVRLIFGTHNFPWTVTITTGKVVAIIALSIGAQAMVSLLIRAFHALHDTKTPLIIGLLSGIVYLTGCYLSVFYSSLGLLGIATATSVAAIIELLLCLIFLHRRVPGLLHPDLWLPQLKMILASFFMAVFLYLPFRIFDELIFDTTRTIELIGLTITTGTIGMLVYIIFAVLLDIQELDYLKRLANAFGRWQQPLAKADEVLVETSMGGDEV